MTKCNLHQIIFMESIKDFPNISSDITSEFGDVYQIYAVCPVCGYPLSEKETKDSLLSLYSEKIADLVYSAFANKQAYLKDIATLTEKGILINFAPKVKNRE